MMPMKTPPLSRPILAGLLALFLVAPAFAQLKAPPSPIDPATGLPMPVPVPETWQKKSPKDINFGGLPLGEVTKTLREYFPELNFLVDQDVAGETINIEQLRNVTLEDILTAINLATKGLIRAVPVNDHLIHLTQGTSLAEQPKVVCRTFSLANYLAVRSDEDSSKALADLEDALKTCWKLLAEADSNARSSREPVMSLHKPTKLLIVAGTTEQLDTVAQVVSQLDTFAGTVPPGFFDISRDANSSHPGAKASGGPGSSSTTKPASGK
jgi:hypothetical protein